MNKGWLLAKKKEMTKVRVGDRFVAVTLLELIPQEVVRYKTKEKDGYQSVVIWLPNTKKNTKDKKKYKKMVEFDVSDEFISKYKEWSLLDVSCFDWIDTISVVWTAKWKGFQWVMKRFNTKWWPETHGSKFHRQIGSLGNRKPRRVQKWHPHAWHMWGQSMTLTNIKILDMLKWSVWWNSESLLVIKWSLPGAYNDLLKCVIL